MARDLAGWADAAEQLVDAATAGPWKADGMEVYAPSVMEGNDDFPQGRWIGETCSGHPQQEADASLAAAAPSLAHALAAVLRAVSDPTAPLTSDICEECHRAMPDPTRARVLAAMAPLAPLFPDTESGSK